MEDFTIPEQQVDIQKSVTDMLKAIPVENFQRCYQNWEQRLHRRVANNFEGKTLFKKNLANKKSFSITFCHT